MSTMAKVDQAGSDPTVLAPTPPMGWNSWNSFATTINEAQALETAQIMAEKLLPSGYDIFTIDIQWYEPGATSYTYNTKPIPTMDGYGRVTPALNRFPSAKGGKGFAPVLLAMSGAVGITGEPQLPTYAASSLRNCVLRSTVRALSPLVCAALS